MRRPLSKDFYKQSTKYMYNSGGKVSQTQKCNAIVCVRIFFLEWMPVPFAVDVCTVPGMAAWTVCWLMRVAVVRWRCLLPSNNRYICASYGRMVASEKVTTTHPPPCENKEICTDIKGVFSY